MNSFPNILFLAAADASASAGVSWQSTADLKAGVGVIAGIIIVVAWLIALIAWFVGAATKDSNPASSKYAFFIVWMFAIGGPVVGLIFRLFVGSAATPTPTF